MDNTEVCDITLNIEMCISQFRHANSANMTLVKCADLVSHFLPISMKTYVLFSLQVCFLLSLTL